MDPRRLGSLTIPVTDESGVKHTISLNDIFMPPPGVALLTSAELEHLSELEQPRQLQKELQGKLGPVGEAFLVRMIDRYDSLSFVFLYRVYQAHLKQLCAVNQDTIQAELKAIVKDFNLHGSSESDKKSQTKSIIDHSTMDLNITGDQEKCCCKASDANDFTEAFHNVFSTSLGKLSNLARRGVESTTSIEREMFNAAKQQAQQYESQAKQLGQQQQPTQEAKLDQKREIGAKAQGLVLKELKKMKDYRSTFEEAAPKSRIEGMIKKFFYKRIIKKPQPDHIKILSQLNSMIAHLEITNEKLNTMLNTKLPENITVSFDQFKIAVDNCMKESLVTYQPMLATLKATLPPRSPATTTTQTESDQRRKNHHL